MKRCLTLVALIWSSLAFAESPASESPTLVKAKSVVDAQLMKPLAAFDAMHSRMSRAMLPPTARRLRMTDEPPRKDSEGNVFLTFEVDARRGYSAEDEEKSWRKKDIIGCVYPDTNQVFVKRNNLYTAAATLIGKSSKAPAESVCQGSPAQLAAGD